MVPTQGYRCVLVICAYGILLLFAPPVSSDQICESFPGTCAPDTCCNPDTCTAEGSSFKCCEDVTGVGCSNCPKCVNCEWTEWSDCGKLEEQCGDGSKPQRVRGEMTRKYKQQAGPGGIECVAADIEGQKRLTKAPCYKECPEDDTTEKNGEGNEHEKGGGHDAGVIAGAAIGALVCIGLIAGTAMYCQKVNTNT